jgi:hypothetical protein
MIDLAATRLSLQAPRRNTLENMIFPKSRRSFFAGFALITLAAGWHAIHHMTPVAASHAAVPHAETGAQDVTKIGAGGSLFAVDRSKST